MDWTVGLQDYKPLISPFYIIYSYIFCTSVNENLIVFSTK